MPMAASGASPLHSTQKARRSCWSPETRQARHRNASTSSWFARPTSASMRIQSASGQKTGLDVKTLTDVLNRLPEERRARVEARADRLIAEEMTLRDLRKARDLTQVRMAELLGIGQDKLSRLEGRADMLLSTLRSYVQAMGGDLEFVARFPDRPDVPLSGLFDNDKPSGAPAQGKGENEQHPA